eukprot:s4197_g8.t1
MAWESSEKGFYGAYGDVPSWGYLTITPGLAILDTGATQDIIGDHALAALEDEDELARKGLQAVPVPTPSSAPTGIGGQAKVLKAVLIPVAFGGIPGVVRFMVPPLLSVGLLAHLGVKLDLETERRSLNIRMPMTRLPSGHRTVPLVQWEGGQLDPPDTAKEQYQLSSDAFMKKPVSSAYTNKGLSGVVQSGEFRSYGEPCPKPEKPVKCVRFQTQDFVSGMQCGSKSGECESIHQNRQVQSELKRELCDRAAFLPAVQLNNRLESSRSQFDFPRDRVHGELVSTDERRGWHPSGGDALEVPHDKGVSDVGDHPPGLPSTRHRRDDSKERAVGASQVLDRCSSGARTLPTSRKPHQEGQPVCELDGDPRSKAKARSRRDNPPDMGMAFAPPSRSSLATSSTTRSSQAPKTEPTIHPELNTTLQAMLAGFREMSSSMKELAQGQSQMMILMQRGLQADVSNMSYNQMQEMVNKAVDEQMQVDNEEDSPTSWAPVLHEENPNELDLPAGGL